MLVDYLALDHVSVKLQPVYFIGRGKIEVNFTVRGLTDDYTLLVPGESTFTLQVGKLVEYNHTSMSNTKS